MRLFTTLTALALGCSCSFGQSVYYFDKGEVATLPQRYGREAIYSDLLAHTLYTGGSLRDSSFHWQPVEADSLHRLRRRNFRGGGAPAGPGVTAGAMRGGLGGSGGYLHLTYTSPKARTALLNIKGNSQVFVNGELRGGDPYSMGFLHLPVVLKKGVNEFYVRGQSAVASLEFPEAPVVLKTDDPTLPSVVLGEPNTGLWGALLVTNLSARTAKGLKMTVLAGGKEVTSTLPDIPAVSLRKVPFRFDGSGFKEKGTAEATVRLVDEKGKILSEGKVSLHVAEPGESHSRTFFSEIDGSLQYYAVTPASTPQTAESALFLSVHGAGVEAIGQARAYRPKDWGTLVAPTNRRPRGFNWEDWGRLDALEVLNLAKARFPHDAKRVYLTGHSMGGHGTWFLGATYPDLWAAIAPCAGYPTLKEYGSADGIIPAASTDPVEQMLLRSGNQSDVPKLASNYKPLGVYIHHGDADRTVPVTYARQMRGVLGEFHPDFTYYEYPGGSHWFGNESVDWNPLFAYFRLHTRPDSVRAIDFMTANPGISSTYRWATIEQQVTPLNYSRIRLQSSRNSISGQTENVGRLKLRLADFAPGTTLTVSLDKGRAVTYMTRSAADSLVLALTDGQWKQVTNAPAFAKNPLRNGTFKEAFHHRMVYVYGTAGTPAENAWAFARARYDAETWYYRGNGAVDIIADTEFSPAAYTGRGVILIGNAQTNRAWPLLLANCPIQVDRNRVRIGDREFKGDDLGTYFLWPSKNHALTSVAVIAGTGLKGMQATNANQYFAGASGFPDFMIFGLDMLQNGSKGVKLAGFYDNDWKPAHLVTNP